MTSTVENLIVIASDDESDSDVEFLREEKDENLDVILVSHTAPPNRVPNLNVTAVPHEKDSCSKKTLTGDAGSQTRVLNRNLSISTNLDLALNLGEDAGTLPFSLSKASTEDDILRDNTTGSVSSYDADDSNFDSDSDSSIASSSSSDVNSDVSTVQNPCISSVKNSTPLTALDFVQAIRNSGLESTCGTSNFSDPCTKYSDFNWNDSKLFSDNNLLSTPALPSSRDHPFDNSVAVNCALTKQPSSVGYNRAESLKSDATQQTAVDVSPTNMTIKREAQYDSHSQPGCSAVKKSRHDDPLSDGTFDLSSWDSVKRDLDFLNVAAGSSTPSLSDSLSHNANQTSAQSLSSSPQRKSGSSSGANSNAGTNDPSYSTSDVSPVFQRRDRLLGTSDNSSSSPYPNQSHLPLKKQIHVRCIQHTSDPVRPDILSSSGMDWRSDSCVSCKISLGSRTSRCLQGHSTCGPCLEESVKLVLTGKSKESLRCLHAGCDSYYPKSELSRSLPSMVVEILNEKLDNDHIEYIANMLMKNATSGNENESKPSACRSSSLVDDEDTDRKVEYNRSISEPEPSPKKNDNFPANWEDMDIRDGPCRLVALEPESPEYVEVALKFHASLTFPTADITKISRVQNHILWKYYSVKKSEMVQDHDGHAITEKTLFHGTNASVVDAICKKGFDWRMCGKHGTMYGQGSYFAVNSSYSHQYTDNRDQLRRTRVTRILHHSSMTFHSGFQRPFTIGSSSWHKPVPPSPQGHIPSSFPQLLSQNKANHFWSPFQPAAQSSNSIGPSLNPQNQTNQGAYSPMNPFVNSQQMYVGPSSSQQGVSSNSNALSLSTPLHLSHPSTSGQSQQIQHGSASSSLSQQNNFSASGLLDLSTSDNKKKSQTVLKCFASTSQQKSLSSLSNVPLSKNEDISSLCQTSNSLSHKLQRQLSSTATNVQIAGSVSSSTNTSNSLQPSTNSGASTSTFDAQSKGVDASKASSSTSPAPSPASVSCKPQSDDYDTQKLKALKVAIDKVKSDPTSGKAKAMKLAILKDLNEHHKQKMRNSNIGSIVNRRASAGDQQSASVPGNGIASSSQAQSGISSSNYTKTSVLHHKLYASSFIQNLRSRSSFTNAGLVSDDSAEMQEVKTTHKMFMARVLVGNYTGGSQHLRKPPPLDEVNDPYGKCYDSCVDHIHDPKIFVIFDSAQAYPEYLIEYQHTT